MTLILALAILPVHGVANASEFNPNFLISDEEMQDASSMGRSDIQAFLTDKGGYISSLRTNDKNGLQRTVADIIYNAAQEHTINPKYLLVKLQKEQSLVSDQDPTQKQLDGATGYGITDGCGWDCETYKNNKGFGKQVDSAAGIIRWYYDHVSSQSFIKRAGVQYAIDSTTVTPANNATAFLYTYTPHLQGNKNFWTLWQRWFDQIYPDGSLVKAADGNTVYLMQNGQKRAFTNFAALTTRYSPQAILTVPASELSRYSSGPDISLPNYSIVKKGSSHYLIDFDVIRPFASEAVVRQLGYHPDEIVTVSTSDLSGYRTGPTISAETAAPLGELVRFSDGSLYYVDNKTLHLVMDEQIAAANYAHLSPTPPSSDAYLSYNMGDPAAFRDGTLVMAPPVNKVFVIEHGKRRHISNEQVFIGLGYAWDNIIRTSENVLTLHEVGQPLYARAADPQAPIASVVVDEKVPVSAEDIARKMVRTPTSNWKFIGQQFDTDIDAYLVADADGNVILGKNVDTVRPLASLAKVMTAYRLGQEGLNLNKVQTYDPSDHKALYHRYRIAPGEKVFNRDLLNAMLVSSLNTPVQMLVDTVDEDQSAFVSRMNEQASSWGLEETLFVDVTGEREQGVSTAAEYLEVWKSATKNLDVNRGLATRSYVYDEFVDNDGYPNHFDSHTNDLYTAAGLTFTIEASKTGYLHESGANLIMDVTRKRDGKKFTIMTLGNVDVAGRFAEPKRLANWALQKIKE